MLCGRAAVRVLVVLVSGVQNEKAKGPVNNTPSRVQQKLTSSDPVTELLTMGLTQRKDNLCPGRLFNRHLLLVAARLPGQLSTTNLEKGQGEGKLVGSVTPRLALIIRKLAYREPPKMQC